jgi:glycosyltransferase involved in cell wall biosynthesis
MNGPIISVVTPSYNQGAYISNAVQSVLSQDYPAVEYFVVDGGSTDGTLAVLQSFGSRLRWKSEPDRGQAAAINKGWRQASGEIVAWLNSDDLYDPGALRRVAEYFIQHPSIDIVYGDCDYIDANGNILRPYPTQAFDFKRLVLPAINYIPQPAAFIRRRLLEGVGYLDENLHYVMDFDYWLRAGIGWEFAYLPVRLAKLRVHESAKSIAKLGDFAAELVHVYQRFFDLPGLSADIGSARSAVMHNVYLRAADSTFWAGQLSQARGYGWRSWLKKPWRMYRLWVYLLLGSLGRNLAEKRLSNPYLVRP